MGLFDGILGGVIGAEMTQVVSGLIEKHGGVQGVVSQLESQGLGETVRSWVGTGGNLPISAEQLQQAFGNGTLQELATKFGVDPQVLAQKLSQVLPHAIDHLTPGGAVPKS
ncbi:MAG TPA: YidB family protein [Steroidobacteraceae bacterium]|nr:YidB family protein [Steroidobacteraceae bacterium]